MPKTRIEILIFKPEEAPSWNADFIIDGEITHLLGAFQTKAAAFATAVEYIQEELKGS